MRPVAPKPTSVGLDASPVPIDLRPYVQAMVERRDSCALGVAIELPDPSPLLQFVIGANYEMRRRGDTGDFAAVPAAALWGPTAAVWEARVAGPVHIYCVVLTHLGATALAKAPIADFVDRRVSLANLGCGGDDLQERLRDAPDFFSRTRVVATWLRGELHKSAVRERHLLSLIEAVSCGHTKGNVAGIAERIGLSARGLHKRFVAITGWSPKQLLRLARLQAALRQIHPGPWDKPLTEDALVEFHDQAHFAHDFKQLTGLTPSQYRSSKRATGDTLINTLYLV